MTTTTHEEALRAARNHVLHLQLQLDMLPTEKEAALRQAEAEAREATARHLNTLAESRPSMEKHIKKQLQKPLLEMSALGRAALKEDR
jgi:hypothetical protein